MARIYPSRLSGPSASMPMVTQAISQTMEYMDTIFMNPPYQRGWTWKDMQSSELISTAMHGGIIPPFILYQYQAGDERPEGMMYECVDGHHRLDTFKHFIQGKKMIHDGKSIMVKFPYTYTEKTILFFSKTDDTVEWENEHKNVKVDYFTPEEQNRLLRYILDIKFIYAPQTIDQRRELFVSLCKGTPLTNCDITKNHHRIDLVAEIAYKKLEKPFCDLLSHCHVQAKRYWLHWMIRCFLLSKTPDSATFSISDKQIEKYIKNDKPTDKLAYTPEELDRYITTMERLLRFNLRPSGKCVKISPTRLFALFVHLLDAQEDRIHELERAVLGWREHPSKHKLWTRNGTTNEERATYFDELYPF